MTAQADVEAPVVPFSREYFLARLGPALVADIEARVADAPLPSPEKVAELRRLFAVPLARLSQ